MIILLILMSLVTYRITRFVIDDTLIDLFRERLHMRLLGKPGWWRDKAYELTTCPYCLSVHVAWMTVLITMIWVSVPLPVLMWLAVSGGAMVVWRTVEVDDDK